MSKKKSVRSKGYRTYQKKPVTISKETWKKIGIGAAALVVIIVLVCLLYDDGSLKVKNDKVVTESNALVLDVNNSSSHPKYYKLGEVSPAEGFTMEEEAGYISDANEFLYYFDPIDPDTCDIDQYYVTTCNGNYAELPEKTMGNISGYMSQCQLGEAVTTQLAGVDVAYYPYTYAKMDEDDETTTDVDESQNVIGYVQSLTAYMPSYKKDCTILVSFTRNMDNQEDTLDDATLADQLTKIIQGITFEKK